MQNFLKLELVESFDGLSTIDVLRWIVFLQMSLDKERGEARLLGMIDLLLRRIQSENGNAMRESPE